MTEVRDRAGHTGNHPGLKAETEAVWMRPDAGIFVKENDVFGQSEITHELARWHMPVVPTDWRLRQGDCKFKVGLDNIEILS